MSREVRRIPIDWQHPTEPNRHTGKLEPVGLCGDLPAALARWEDEGRDIANRTGFEWEWALKTDLKDYDSEDDLHAYVTAQHVVNRPRRGDYMPVWPEGVTLGWCLYETISEGTPVTPVFATAGDLVDHLTTVGDWNGPYRRKAAEQLVNDGCSFGTLFVTGGKLFNSAQDADVLAALPKGEQS